MAQDDLQKRLERLGRALLEDVERWEASTRARRTQLLSQVHTVIAEKIEDAVRTAVATREERREQRRQRRARRRAEQRERQLAQASAPGGLVLLLVAAVCAAVGYTDHDLFWLLFVALGLSISGARQLSLVAQRRSLQQRTEAAQKALQPAPPRHEVDELCDQLLADLRASPQVVRTFLVDPERTVDSMRKTTRALDERRRQLKAEVEASRLEAVEAQRTQLAARVQEAADPELRARLEAALRSSDGQLAALRQLRTAADRVDGEYVSLLALLRELKARITLARTTGAAGSQLDDVRASVRRLNEELEAITEAMESVKRDEVAAVSAITSSADDAPVPPQERVR